MPYTVSLDDFTHEKLVDVLRSEDTALTRAAANAIAYLSAQEGLLESAQQRCEALTQELAEIKRPLDDQMARLNAKIVHQTAIIRSCSHAAADIANRLCQDPKTRIVGSEVRALANTLYNEVQP